ncbi:hypothetical protein [Streptomyces triticiradicis]|uniref:Uncharacterized protein n=1 Tax=Streptomyces triticiradicis TaxID=2651189 RepID=A0A7J5D603_9ACTN|nr:hypothetical protein [Streptomyces triticiradicis]KAB1979261.1 hypothetical protein F8144_36465 [Streptomyces triticiradicis]
MPITPKQAQARSLTELRALYSTVTDWDAAVYDQVVLHLADASQPIGMNQIRTIVPDGAAHSAGLYFHQLVGHDVLHPSEPALLIKIDEEVSINPKAHGKKVNVYRLTRAGRKFIEDRQAARIEQRQAA